MSTSAVTNCPAGRSTRVAEASLAMLRIESRAETRGDQPKQQSDDHRLHGDVEPDTWDGTDLRLYPTSNLARPLR
jgi:hypothetical protein